MEKQQIKELITNWGLNTEFKDSGQHLEITITSEQLHEIALKLKNSPELQFDFLLSATAIDWLTHLTTVYHLTSSVFHHIVVLKTNISDRDNPEIETLSDLWPTADSQEREIFDLFGIKFRNHKDLRRLFLDDNWVGFPLRKDYTDENIKELK